MALKMLEKRFFFNSTLFFPVPQCVYRWKVIWEAQDPGRWQVRNRVRNGDLSPNSMARVQRQRWTSEVACDTGSVKVRESSDTARGGVGGNLGDGMTGSCSTRHTTGLLVAPSDSSGGLGGLGGNVPAVAGSGRA